jgi:hypothetical protein
VASLDADESNGRRQRDILAKLNLINCNAADDCTLVERNALRVDLRCTLA